MPLSTTDWNWYTSTADSINAQYPANTSELLSMDFLGWAQQSYQIAIDHVYPGFTTGQTPTTTYDNQAIPAVETNMNLGALRLANLIETIYGTNSLFLQWAGPNIISNLLKEALKAD